MKSKNIPDDIKSKSIKEAQNEIKDIISNLENTETDLKQSIDQYNRMIQLNHYIQEKFKEKLGKIRSPKLDTINKPLKKNN
jgi:exonuclease VII small subunit